MSQSKQFEGAIERLTFNYQKLLREMNKVESEWLRTPSKILSQEVIQIQGHLKGLKFAINVLEEMRCQNELALRNTDIH